MIDLSWRNLREKWLTTAVLLRSIPVGVVIAAGIVATTWTHSLLSSHQELVVHTFKVIDTTKDVLIGLDDAETGQRGYLLSADQRYLEPYAKALDRLTTLRVTLAQLIADNGAQIGRVARLNTLIDAKLGELQKSIAFHDESGFEAAQREEVGMMERATMDDIRHVIGEMTEAEKALLASRQSQVESDEHRIRLVAIAIGLCSFLTRAGVELYLARRGITAENRSAVRANEANATSS
ncbi:CHASE3 domain-containing protein [Mesorhizobium sp. RP14(2022)]|uniref:CHASE3 domain-containing protein n=1 Tax=Mesorhizobium liriopis TaxID=2953882 RepID=A0ABT1C609_9HYPH|nr:CHASE3 domain-containing protein [Mesorhizobium liriopis]MCO6050254.1 CHASE3 domain-containing protein [Mesorhizobium liriopis]